MKTYTVHFPKGTADVSENALAEAILIKDGFSWGAFFFGPFWLFWNCLWLAGFLVLAAMIALSVVFDAIGVHQAFASLADFLAMFLIGLEANSLKRWTFERKGRPSAGIVSGHDDIEAEAKLIVLGLHRRSHAGRHGNPAVPAIPLSSASGAASPTPWLFPSSERPR